MNFLCPIRIHVTIWQATIHDDNSKPCQTLTCERHIRRMRQGPDANIFSTTRRCACAQLVYFQSVRDALQRRTKLNRKPKLLISLINFFSCTSIKVQRNNRIAGRQIVVHQCYRTIELVFTTSTGSRSHLMRTADVYLDFIALHGTTNPPYPERSCKTEPSRAHLSDREAGKELSLLLRIRGRGNLRNIGGEKEGTGPHRSRSKLTDRLFKEQAI